MTSRDEPARLEVFRVALWFGLVTGLIEGLGLILLQRFSLLPWNMGMTVAGDIIWISPVLDVLLMLLVAGVLWGITAIVPRIPLIQATVYLLAFLAFLDFLFILGRMRHSAIAILAAGLATVFWRWFSKHQAAALRFFRNSLPWFTSAVVLAFAITVGGEWLHEQWTVHRLPAALPGSPNILVIVLDTVRADHLSGYGYSRATSPNLDRIAHEGALFEESVSTSSWTLPSHASLLTGRFPFEHGATMDKLDQRLPTLGEVLQSRGYRTGAFSANLLEFTAKEGFGRGFIRFEGPFHSLADMAFRTVFGRKFEQFVLRRLGHEDIPARKLASDVNRGVLHWIQRDPGVPFFAFLNYFDAHTPYLPPQPYRSQFSKNPNPGGLINWHMERPWPDLTPEQIQSEMDAYDGAIAYMDAQLGILLAELEKNGVAKNLLLVVVSDHGEAFGDHGFIDHRNSLYRGQTHVPTILWWRGHIPAGAHIERPVSIAWVPTTVMDLIGAPRFNGFQGPSLVSALTSPDHKEDWPYPLAELAHLPFESKRNPCRYGWMKALMSPDWHYIVHEKFGEELYDWKNDPAESNNLAKTTEGQGITKEFAQRLQNQLGHSPKQ